MLDSVAIDKTKYKDYIWLVVALYVSRLIWREYEPVFLFVYLGLILLIIGFAKKIFLPNIVGLYPYILLTIVLAGIGLVLHRTRYVERDLFYIIPSILLVILGYYLYSFYGDKSIVKTVVFCGVISSIYTFINFLFRNESISELQDVRDYFNIDIYEICMIFLVLVIFVFNSQLYVFGKKLDIIVLILLLAQIILSMSRSVWVEIMVGVPTIIVINLIFNYRKVGTYIKTAIIISLAIAGVALLYTYAPKGIIDDYTEKVENTSSELNKEQEFNSIEDAMQHWRAYENQSATKQWEDSTPLVQLFGAGLGKGVHIKYIPYSWDGMVENNSIPLLHNGYYTMLSKGGIVGVVILIIFLGYPALLGIKSLRKKGYSAEAVSLITISVAFMTQTYVVRGPINQTPIVTWGILVGWFCGQLKSEDY